MILTFMSASMASICCWMMAWVRADTGSWPPVAPPPSRVPRRSAPPLPPAAPPPRREPSRSAPPAPPVDPPVRPPSRLPASLDFRHNRYSHYNHIVSLIITSSACQTSEETTASGATKIPKQSSIPEGELPALWTQASASCCKWDGWKTEGGEDSINEVLNGSLDGGLEDAGSSSSVLDKCLCQSSIKAVICKNVMSLGTAVT